MLSGDNQRTVDAISKLVGIDEAKGDLLPDQKIERVRELNLKKNLGEDPECQVLEDALCLVTLQYQLGELMDKTEPDKMVDILRKSWGKMSPAAREQALALPLGPAELALVQRALEKKGSAG